MPKFILINDLHLSTRTPSSRLDNFHDTMMAKLEQIYTLAVKIKADAILIAGDIFNEKTGVLMSLVFELFMWCWKVKAAGIRIVSIPGNHDLRHDRYDSLPIQPLGLIYIGRAMENASFDLINVAGVDITGIPYPAAKDRTLWDGLPRPTTRHSIVMGHCFATPSGGTYYGEPILPYSSLANLPYSVFHFGHDHSDNGVALVEGKFFVNIGALSRGSIAIENVVRDVKCCLIETPDGSTADTGDVVRAYQVKLNVRPANEIFDLVLRERVSRERSDIEQFVSTISDELSEATVVNFRDKLEAMGLTDVVRKRVLAYVEAAETAS